MPRDEPKQKNGRGLDAKKKDVELEVAKKTTLRSLFALAKS